MNLRRKAFWLFYYRTRVMKSKKIYNRQKYKQDIKQEVKKEKF